MGRRRKKKAKTGSNATAAATTEIRHSFPDSSLAHDVREINKQLKGNLERVSTIIKQNRNILGREERHIKSAQVLAEMLTNRLDVYDFYKNRGNFNAREVKKCLHREITKLRHVLETCADKKRVRIEIGDSRVEISCSSKFSSALFVILENAIKYSPDGGVITVTIEECASEIFLRIHNHGPQLLPDEISKVFKYEVRGQNSQKYARVGSGIGMHYAKELCDLHFFTISFRQDKTNSLSKDGFDFALMTTEITIPRNL